MVPPADDRLGVGAFAAAAWPVVEVARDGHILAANAAFAACLDRPLPLLAGISFADLLWPADRDMVSDLLAGRRRSATVRVAIGPTGLRTLALTVDHRPSGVASFVAQDVSGLADDAAAGPRGTDGARYDGEQRFRDLFEASSDQWWEMDADLRFTYLSPNSEGIIGMTPETVIGRGLDLFATGDGAWREHLATLAARQPFRDFVYRRDGGDGRVRWIKTSGKPIFDAQGGFRGYRGVGTDVTAQVMAEAQASLTRDRLLHAIENIGHPITIIDGDDLVVVANRAYRDLHRGRDGRTVARAGMSRDDLLQWRLDNGFYERPGGEHAAIKEEVRRWREEPHTIVVRLSGGREMMIDMHRLPNGDRVVVWTDVTALYHAEERRRELEAHLHRKQRLEALGTLAGGIAHDLNNTLVPVMALSKLLARRFADDGRAVEHLDLIYQAAGRGRDLVKRVLAFSRQEAPEMRSLDLSELVRSSLALLRASLPSTIKLTSSLDAVPAISGDPGQLHQVLLNLVTNGAHAIGTATGTVDLTVAGAAGWVRLIVEDTGEGMSGEILARIFEPFFTTKPTGEGTGLGLSVVHGIVAGHGGTIGVTSDLGRGTRFDVRFPVALSTTTASKPAGPLS